MRNKPKIGSILILLAGFISNTCCGNNQLQQVCFTDNCFWVELAITPGERTDGLMFRKYMPEDRGMLFLFPDEDNHSFWMKNTLIPLDIIWIGRDKKVVFIKPYAQPCASRYCPVITPDKKAKYVLEVNGGICEKIGLKIDDTLDFVIKKEAAE